MALTVLPQQRGSWDEALRGLGQGLGEGTASTLDSLAKYKLNEIKRRHTASGLEALSKQTNQPIDPQTAEMISRLDPILQREYVKGLVNPKQPLINQQIGGKPALTPAQEKHRDSIRSSYEINKNLVDTTVRMLDELESGKIQTGLIPHLKSEYWPTLLNKESGIYAKDAANVLTWTTEAQKGLQSKYRIQQTLKGKPGLNQLPEVNEHVLREINKRAQRNLDNFEKDYPGFNLEDADNYDYEDRHPGYSAQSSEEGEELDEKPDATTLPDNTQWIEENGERQIVKDGQWVPY